MNDKILIKKSSDNIQKELESVDFSREYLSVAKSKYKILSLKIFDLKPAEANILKQTCLSLGFDAAVGRDVITCKCEKSDAIICGSEYQFLKLSEKLAKQPFRLKSLSKEILKIIQKPDFYTIGNNKFYYDKTYIMGILNVTPDSFSDGGKYSSVENAYIHALEMADSGAEIIDVGGESTRPDAERVTWQTECERVLPVIEKIKQENSKIIISVDTIHPETIVRAIECGADILNTVADISVFEPVFDFLSEQKTPIIITHSDGVPPKPIENDFDGDIVEKIFKYFAQKIDYLKTKGLNDNLFILDAGIGFGKSKNDQFQLIKRADEFYTLGCPILYGISRKSFISKTFGVENRDKVSEIYAQYLMSKHVNILRVHDVDSHNQIRNFLEKLR